MEDWVYAVRIDQGDFLVLRGGFDWGRGSRGTTFRTEEAAADAAKMCGSAFREVVRRREWPGEVVIE